MSLDLVCTMLSSPEVQSALVGSLTLHLALPLSRCRPVHYAVAFGLGIFLAFLLVGLVVYHFLGSLASVTPMGGLGRVPLLFLGAVLGCAVPGMRLGMPYFWRTVALNLSGFVWALLQYRYELPPDHLLTLGGRLTHLPVGWLYFVLSGLLSAAVFWGTGWLASESCEDCGAAPAELTCRRCDELYGTLSLCDTCHAHHQPPHRTEPVRRLGQRCLAVMLMGAGVAAILLPTVTPVKVGVALACVAVRMTLQMALRVLKQNLHNRQAAQGAAPGRFISLINAEQYAIQTEETTARELAALRVTMQGLPETMRLRLSPWAQAGLPAFVETGNQHYRASAPRVSGWASARFGQGFVLEVSKIAVVAGVVLIVGALLSPEDWVSLGPLEGPLSYLRQRYIHGEGATY